MEEIDQWVAVQKTSKEMQKYSIFEFNLFSKSGKSKIT
jgi:hypothetical protein